MTKLHFITPSQIDMREVVTLGLGSKRGDETKIGHKGSGMKFTLALLHRLGSSLTVTVDGRTWQSSVFTVNIRGIDHQLIKLTADNGEERDTGIALSAGEDTWQEPWFALRELLQNVIDENGSVRDGDLNNDPAALTNSWRRGEDGKLTGTVMTIEMTAPLVEAWAARDNWHHARHPEVMYSANCIGGLFYHGFRVYSDPEWTRCYDVTDIFERENLSEDRQARNLDTYSLFREIVQKAVFPLDFYPHLFAMQGDTLKLAEAIYHHIDADKPDIGTFKLSLLEAEWVRRYGERTACCLERSERLTYFAKCAGYSLAEISHALWRLVRYSKVIKSADSLIPALAARLRPASLKGLDGTAKARISKARRLTASLAPLGCQVLLVEPGPHDTMNTAGMALIEENKVLVVRSWAEKATLLQLVECLIEEFTHLSSKATDCSADFEKALIRSFAERLMPRVKAENAI